MTKIKHILTYFLVLYVLCLSVQPCADEVASKDIQIEISSATHQHELCVDYCSPFCVCGCCQSSFVPYNGIDYKLFNAYSNLIYVVDSTQNFSKYEVKVWQPPKNIS